MNTRHAQLVLAVVREGSFTAAAKSLFVTQPTLSQQIRQIEQQLGQPIFERSTTPVSLTPAGRYDAVRITIGSGSGQNWWCVLYPGLCRSACGGYAIPQENDLVCGDYILRLRFVDWWNRHTASRATRVLAG